MHFVDEFRNPEAARALADEIRSLAGRLPPAGRPRVIMEVCGSHSMAIGRFGLRKILPPEIDLVSGPGCPVCVTGAGYLDAALELAGRGARIVTFGDLLNVPGSDSSLAQARSKGARIRICYSPLEAAEEAREHPDEPVVFLAIGFETTIAPVIKLVEAAERERIDNLFLLTAFKRVLPALEALAVDPDLKINAFLCPAHVSAIIGSAAYGPFVRAHALPCVVAGFEPLDILLGVRAVARQWLAGVARVDNVYARVARPEGNPEALRVLDQYLVPAEAYWRGLGGIPDSGYVLRPEYARYDAARLFDLEVKIGREAPGCRCGEVIKGKLKPRDCPLFEKACTPDHPIGPCMVSSEGSCAAAYLYERAG